MFVNRYPVFLLLTLLCSITAFAQRPGPQFRRPLACEPLEPRTKLEEVDWRYERVLIKGFTQVALMGSHGAEIRVDAVELKDVEAATRVTGLVIALRTTSDNPRENRSWIDYEEIDRLLKGIDAVSRVNETNTKLASFEARYRTLGDFEVNVFRQSRSGAAASVTSGTCDRVSGVLTLDELDRLRAYIVEAKTRLDEIK
jgi:hypothetical protein